MSKIKALNALAKKVENGTWDCLSEEYPLPANTYSNFGRACEDGSLDAAIKLFEASLHELSWGWSVNSSPEVEVMCNDISFKVSECETAARCLLLAIIQALIYVEECNE